jgi:hypothetical protein
VRQRTNKNKVQWKQGTKAREQGTREQGTRARRPTGPDVIFRRQNNVKQKKMQKGKKNDLVDYYYNQNKFKKQSVENQRFDFLNLTSALMEYADNDKLIFYHTIPLNDRKYPIYEPNKNKKK